MLNFRLLSMSALLVLPSAAFASPITFGSFAGTTVTYTGAPAPIAPGDTTPTSGAAVAYTGTSPYSVANYPAPVGGTVYITYDNSTEFLPSGTTAYSISVQGGSGGSGSLQFVADDSVTVFLNGTQIGSSSNFNAVTTDPFTLAAGTNTFVFNVTNAPQPQGAANPTALDFYGTATTASVTPEPSSLVLLGSGILGLAGAARRRFVKA